MIEAAVKNKKRTYIAIDLKSFYASVECHERGLDPLTTNLVVADAARTEKTICLAVSPSLKVYGIPGRARLFEVVQKIREVNAVRRTKAPGHRFTGSSSNSIELDAHPELELEYITAVPRMAEYMKYSGEIYKIYLQYAAPEDIHVYSIDEVFIDVTDYLPAMGINAHELTLRIIRHVLRETGITATAGIAPNLFLCKVAMDIVAKHIPADKDGVRIAELDEKTYREKLWSHTPLTDFWRVGRGYAKRLTEHGIYTMGDIAKCSIGREDEYYNEDLLYRLFGVNAELLIDHAWGWEPCTMAHIKAYRPEAESVGSGQVLQCPYTHDRASIVLREMAFSLALDLVGKKQVTDQLVLHVGYDVENLNVPELKQACRGKFHKDHYGRMVPKPAHGSIHLSGFTSSYGEITSAVIKLYEDITVPELLIRRLSLSAEHVASEDTVGNVAQVSEFSLFEDISKKQQECDMRDSQSKKEKSVQEAILGIQGKFGKNAILMGTDMQDGATMKERNMQIGGHKA